MNFRSSHQDEKGYTLAVVAVFTTVLLVSLSAAAINWQKAMQREREEELVFRGKQFMRAIELWQRKFPGTYPTTIDALLSTNNTRFLRKKWKDPITNSDDWRLIKVNPDGSVSGLTVTPTNSPLGPSTYGSSGSNSSTRQGSGGLTGNTRVGGLGQTGGTGTTRISGTVPSQRGQGQSAFNPVLGGIVGVASKSEKESLKAYNGKNKYNEWEFYYVPRTGTPNLPSGQPQGPQRPESPGTVSPAQQPRQR